MGDGRSTEKEHGGVGGWGRAGTEADKFAIEILPEEEEGQGGRWGRDLQV